MAKVLSIKPGQPDTNHFAGCNGSQFFECRTRFGVRTDASWSKYLHYATLPEVKIEPLPFRDAQEFVSLAESFRSNGKTKIIGIGSRERVDLIVKAREAMKGLGIVCQERRFVEAISIACGLT